MSATRREFIKSLGIALVSLLLTRSNRTSASAIYDRLRACWLGLGQLAREAREVEDGSLRSDAQNELLAAHHAALQELVLAGELDESVADQIQNIYRETVQHVWVSNSGFICYELTSLGMLSARTRDDFVRQTRRLAFVAADSDIDSETIAKVQAAIEQDLALFQAVDAFYESELRGSNAERRLERQFKAGELEIDPETIQAARVLVKLLLQE